jgi:PPOX class probable F420-dependent enzyme
VTDVNARTEAFLKRLPTLVLGTVRSDGSPQASAVWYLWTRGEFLISTVTRTAKWHNLKRDARCSVCVEDPTTGQMVVAYGSAELREDDVREDTRAIVAKYYPERPADTQAHMDRIFSSSDRRVIVALAPESMITRRLGE